MAISHRQRHCDMDIPAKGSPVDMRAEPILTYGALWVPLT